ncbi:hypothetical protein H4R99_001011 [Coemansia sp. RSA 1722]|nr:hypothetical protein GGF39_001168 [Coemansia sp. RSA 1721]KAJ2605598.1 hypothetical protein H4R99_001011 [Coemansia sp. RSA 1722]KAJ2639014.1 hypothetical protein GGF40_001197 [Coemansia sp. RSA 1286]
MNPPSQQRVVVVTKVGSWVGAETAVALLRHDVTVIGLGTNAARIDTLHQALHRQLPPAQAARFRPLVGRLTDRTFQDTVAELINQQGTLTALVNNAGAYEDHDGSIAGSSTFDQWDALQRSLVDPLLLFHRIRHVLQRNKCVVVNVASDDVHSALPRHVSLVAIKTAVNLITAEIALVVPQVIAVAVHPAAPATRLPPEERPPQHPNTPLAADLIVDLALNADRAATGQYYMYTEPEFLTHQE